MPPLPASHAAGDSSYSPRLQVNNNSTAMPTTSPRHSYSGPTPTARPALMKRQSSQSSHSSSLTEQQQQQLSSRHHVKPRHTKFVLPRNHSSARNLAKLGRQPSANGPTVEDDARRHSRQRSHEGDTEIRLPGSLEEQRPQMRRNMTAYQLPRNTSHAKLKKNLSHGQLTRLASGRNISAVLSNSTRAPPSPGLRGRSKRNSAQQAEQLQLDQPARRPSKKREASKKVGFAVGSAGDSSDGEDVPDMEGSGMQEDEWTDQSASASPYSTRQNTANNSRRPSVNGTMPPRIHAGEAAQEGPLSPLRQQVTSSEGRGYPSVGTGAAVSARHDGTDEAGAEDYEDASPRTSYPSIEEPVLQSRPRSASNRSQTINHITKRLLEPSQQHTAPALLSNISALDDTHSAQETPAQSLKSSRSDLEEHGEGEQDELVSRFVPSSSHPSIGSGANTTAVNTPKQNSYSSPEEHSHLASRPTHKSHNNQASSAFQLGTVSPGSTMSGSSGATTPAIGRSRTELRLLHEKALADMESAAAEVYHPILPAHIYDRRNESLKSHLDYVNDGNFRSANASTSASHVDLAHIPIGHQQPQSHHHSFSNSSAIRIGPELFQGRFRAVNTELRVVQKFRDPISESIARLSACRSSQVAKRTAAAKRHSHGNERSSASNGLTTSRSAITLAHRPARSSDADSPLKRAALSSVQISGTRPGTSNTTSATSAAASLSSLGDRRSVISAGDASSDGRMSSAGNGDGPQRSSAGVGGERQKARREVSFARTPPETREFEQGEDEMTAEAIARRIWDS